MATEAQNYLRDKQYGNSTNLLKRAGLHSRFSTSPVKWLTWVFDQLEIPDDAAVLEVGAGPGGLWMHNRDRIPSGWRVTLTDFSEGMVAEQRENLSDLGERFDFQCADAQALPFPDGAFDCVIANHMLYHVPDIPTALREIRRVLAVNGRFYAATNGNKHMGEFLDIIRMFVPGFEPVGQTFRLENGEALLAEQFSSVETRRFDDNLVVTEAEPLCDYVRSMGSLCNVTESQIGRIQERIRSMMEAEGKIRISKDAGLFISQNGDDTP